MAGGSASGCVSSSSAILVKYSVDAGVSGSVTPVGGFLIPGMHYCEYRRRARFGPEEAVVWLEEICWTRCSTFLIFHSCGMAGCLNTVTVVLCKPTFATTSHP